MKVTVDTPRLIHLAVLVVLTYAGAMYLIDQWELSGLTAFGISCFAVCQVSNVFMKLHSPPPAREILDPNQKVSSKTKKKRKAY